VILEDAGRINERNFDYLEAKVDQYIEEGGYGGIECEINPCIRSEDHLCDFSAIFRCAGISHSTRWFNPSFFDLDSKTIHKTLVDEFNKIAEELAFCIGENIMMGNYHTNLKVM
jgi:hypothetical protein